MKTTFEKYDNFYNKSSKIIKDKPNKPSKIKKGGSTTTNFNTIKKYTSEQNSVYLIKVFDDNDNLLNSYFIKFFIYDDRKTKNPNDHDSKKLENINKLLSLATWYSLDIDIKDVGKGFYEYLFYDKINNLTKDDSNINIIKIKSYGFISDFNPNFYTIEIDNNDVDITQIIYKLLYNFDESDKITMFFMVTDFNPNIITLKKYVSDMNPFDYNKTKTILKKIENMLNFLYNKYGFIHCDLHWDNILIDTTTFNPYLFDFDFSCIGGIINEHSHYIGMLTCSYLFEKNTYGAGLEIFLQTIFIPFLKSRNKNEWDEQINNSKIFFKTIICKEIFHAIDYYNLYIYELINIIQKNKISIDIHEDILDKLELKKYVDQETEFVKLLKAYYNIDINELNSAYQTTLLWIIDNNIFSKILLISIFLYCSQINSHSILNIKSNKKNINLLSTSNSHSSDSYYSNLYSSNSYSSNLNSYNLYSTKKENTISKKRSTESKAKTTKSKKRKIIKHRLLKNRLDSYLINRPSLQFLQVNSHSSKQNSTSKITFGQIPLLPIPLYNNKKNSNIILSKKHSLLKYLQKLESNSNST